MLIIIKFIYLCCFYIDKDNNCDFQIQVLTIEYVNVNIDSIYNRFSV
ncbi:hypothetical protein KL86DYS1_20010 [uncultured Dysgonomonas sp.]|uniref:Uncharacterized protein n=1 Tax=uncultured Dysgonomonas sp. TaxID=206096 RepID=A0A212JJW0_9BACT|nr:hypothetical protein KL86DYS1_20010 [uncultured Dysgonomonas sp.]